MAEYVGLKDLHDVFHRVDLVAWLKIKPIMMNISLNALEMLVMIWITIYSSNHHRYLYAREKSSKNEHVTALPLRSSESGKNVRTNTYTDNDKVMSSMMKTPWVPRKNDPLLGYV